MNIILNILSKWGPSTTNTTKMGRKWYLNLFKKKLNWKRSWIEWRWRWFGFFNLISWI